MYKFTVIGIDDNPLSVERNLHFVQEQLRSAKVFSGGKRHHQLVKDFLPDEWFKDSYGVVRDPDVPVEKVVIRAFGKEASYLRDLLLHHSQKEICKEERFSDFALTNAPKSIIIQAKKKTHKGGTP